MAGLATGEVHKSFDSNSFSISLSSSFPSFPPQLVAWPSSFLCSQTETTSFPTHTSSSYNCKISQAAVLTSCPSILQANQNFPQFLLSVKSDNGFVQTNSNSGNLQCNNLVKFNFTPPEVSLLERALSILRLVFNQHVLVFITLALVVVLLYVLFFHKKIKKRFSWLKIKVLRFLKLGFKRLKIPRLNPFNRKKDEDGFRFNDVAKARDWSSESVYSSEGYYDEGFSSEEEFDERVIKGGRGSSARRRKRGRARGVVSRSRGFAKDPSQKKFERGRSRMARS
eukprot:snap_masked-scaffold_6-processed-gene-11.49-mRNA-1 protein AED:1.00 eAED:1.00 QI:0/0/0/0/1/1/2/0/281